MADKQGTMAFNQMKSKIEKMNQTLQIAEDINTDDTISEYITGEIEVFDDKYSVDKSTGEVEEITKSLDEYKALKNDFVNIRETLNDTISDARKLSSSLSDVIIMGEDVDPLMIQAYTSLITAINNTAKLSLDIYGKLVETKQKLNTLFTVEEKANVQSVTNNNTVIVASTADVLKKLGSK